MREEQAKLREEERAKKAALEAQAERNAKMRRDTEENLARARDDLRRQMEEKERVRAAKEMVARREEEERARAEREMKERLEREREREMSALEA